jgi:hypothetical protein
LTRKISGVDQILEPLTAKSSRHLMEDDYNDQPLQVDDISLRLSKCCLLDDPEPLIPFELVSIILVEADNETIFTCFCVCWNWNSLDHNSLFYQLAKKRFNLKNYKKYDLLK